MERFGGIKQAYGEQYFLWNIQLPHEKSNLLVSPRAEKKIKAIFLAEMRRHKLRCLLQILGYRYKRIARRVFAK